MRTGVRGAVVAVTAATMLAACSAGSDPSPTTEAPLTPDTTTTVDGTLSEGPTPATTASPSASSSATTSTTAGACEPFGTTQASQSSTEWSSDLRTAPGDELWGVLMRLDHEPCYERWTLRFDGDGGMPGWSVTPYYDSTYTEDMTGQYPNPPLAGEVQLVIAFGAWYDGEPLGHERFGAPLSVTSDLGIAEARIMGAFEGISEVAFGLRGPYPYRVTWLTDPSRLAIDFFTGAED